MIPTANHQKYQYCNRNSRRTFPRYRPANLVLPQIWIPYRSKFFNMPPKHRTRSGPLAIAEELLPRRGLALKRVAIRSIIDPRTSYGISEIGI
jgi:hypothetical protein